MKRIRKLLKQNVLLIFFFINSVGLPSPLLWSNFLSIAYFKSFLNRRSLLSFGSVLLLFGIYLPIHLGLGVSEGDYFKSLVVYFFILLSIPAAYQFINDRKEEFTRRFRQIAIVSFALFCLSLILFLFDSNLLWQVHDFQGDGQTSYRYKAFTYEPSYYALLFLPICLYFLLKSIHEISPINIGLLLCAMIPVLATISFGFFAVLLMSAILSLLIVLVQKRFLPFRFSLFVIVGILCVLLSVFTIDLIAERASYILQGKDTSINGRTTEAFFLATEMIKAKSEIFGIGHGQIKILGEEYIRPFYLYSKESWPTVALPNALAETLAVFGFLGLSIRLGLQLFIFYYFRVADNLFNLCMFIFLFIYQFMGSFYMSGTEIVFWVLCTIKVFPEFNMQVLRRRNRLAN